MFMYPRKGLITDPYNQEDIIIQDDQFPPDFAENSQQYQQSYLQPPFQYQPNQFASPPSSAPSSPTFSSPTFSITHPPQAVDCQSYGAPSMTPASSYNPSLDIQSSASPSSQQYLSQYPQYYSPMLAQPPIAPSNQAWDGNLQLLSPARIPSYPQKASPSSTSSRSAPNTQHRRSDSSNKPLPTPVQTPLQNSFLAPAFQNYDPLINDGSSVEAESAMRRAIIEQQYKHQQSPPQHQQGEYSHSLAPSVSTVSQNSPVTPQTTLDELEDASKSMTNEYANGNSGMPIGVPKLNRTISDIYQDELYNPAMMAAPQMSKPMGQNLMAPRNVIADRLQAANQGHMSARSQSPVSGMIKRERSPFRQNSPFTSDMNASGLQPQMATSVPMSQNGMSMASTMSQGDLKTMSPKDAVLDFNENDDAAMAPLFPPQQGDFNLGDALGLRRESSGSSLQPALTMDAFPSQYAPVSQAPFSFTQQSQPPQTYLQQPKLISTLPRVDSNGSDLHSSAEMTPQAHAKPISRPTNTNSDAGTYTCTYHGCTLRFESPAKLQRHKREAHRQTSPGGHLITRDTSLRNSQAGPHKCERLNPSTGKPCNSVFSRPYDLTRHEDTIHNARKLKVRCHLCTEEKTFSRNDALTRHMRVVHPEVDWPGKQRRRGRD
ncbi:transcriptional regulator family: C2H2 zinc finger [Penicillium longicatenatum]|uniref:transcriptional regulator family: C2H2 zinc finger n=1 Tax=Penicillium longicatenatum TaxID=1561947 RepID=UPI002546840E|nr:transcriptional regulator family: C2H2 zinc finger [Penicillium longicatenatum]KAJ5658734.1 transcriptional regulator family: C2H2 zinc finger [Penicillium longicatenatum]